MDRLAVPRPRIPVFHLISHGIQYHGQSRRVSDRRDPLWLYWVEPDLVRHSPRVEHPKGMGGRKIDGGRPGHEIRDKGADPHRGFESRDPGTGRKTIRSREGA